jgi:diguanylate cyclase (GGDEF)-like protein
MDASAAVVIPHSWLASLLGIVLTLAVGAVWWVRRRQAAALAAARRSGRQVGPESDAGLLMCCGLIPRVDFDDRLESAAGAPGDASSMLSVLVLDIDGFAAVNEAVGHRRGDEVLLEVASRLHRAAPTRLAATRLGGDAFVLLFDHDLAGAKRQAELLQAALTEPLAVGEGSLRLTASIGIAQYPLHGARSRLIACAVSAMRAVKTTGGNDWAVYDPRAAIDLQAQRALVDDLRVAVERRQFELVYQPKIDARSLQVTAAEALLRWHHPTLGMVSPTVFVPLAERYGLIGAIGDWVIDDACRQAGRWRKAGLRMRVAINLSAYQMRQDDVVCRLQAALRANDLDPRRFTVEITESLALENTRATQRTFEGLRRAGLHVAIDDFGAGQTSLAYLRQLPVSELKMDIGLVRDVATRADARVIAEAVIRMAHALEMRVVAEGVETQAQRDQLVALGVDELQGFLFARPMSARALGLWALDPEVATHDGFRPSLFQNTAVPL